MFEHYQTSLPVLVHRNCVMIFDTAVCEKLQKMGLAPADVFLDENHMIKKYITKNAERIFSMETVLNNMDDVFKEVIEKVSNIDATLKQTVEGEKQKLQKSLKAIEERVIRAEKKKHEITISQLKKIKEKLFPQNKLQERHENLLSFYARYGDDFLSDLLIHLDPSIHQFILLTED
jgi:uncharacterized protein YllA (UPF0747 family)